MLVWSWSFLHQQSPTCCLSHSFVFATTITSTVWSHVSHQILVGDIGAPVMKVALFLQWDIHTTTAYVGIPWRQGWNIGWDRMMENKKNDTRRQPDTSWKPSPQMPGSFRNPWETRGSENVRNMAFTRIILHRFLCYRTFPCHGSWLQMADIIWFRIFIKIYNKISFQCFNWAWCPVERNKQLIIIN